MGTTIQAYRLGLASVYIQTLLIFKFCRDNATLEKLGVTGAAQVRELSNQIAKKRNALHEKLFNDDPAGSTGNKTTLQKVMKKKSVSEDMGLNLLKATPGSLQVLHCALLPFIESQISPIYL